MRKFLYPYEFRERPVSIFVKFVELQKNEILFFAHKMNSFYEVLWNKFFDKKNPLPDNGANSVNKVDSAGD